MLRRCAALISLAWLTLATVAFAESTTEPTPRLDDWWKQRHEAVNRRVKEGNVDLIFIGDSITQSWESEGKNAWEEHFGKLNAVNMGFSGDRTQHVLWRLDNGNVDGIQPKAAVLMIGTNNSNGNDNTAEEIADGIAAIVKKLREKLPKTKVLVLAIFPRSEKSDAQREKNAKASEIASKLADDKMVFFLDIGPKFLQDDQTLSKELMPDFLHLTPKGYEIWAEGVDGKVHELMGK